MTYLTIRKVWFSGMTVYHIRLKKPNTPEYIIFEDGTLGCTFSNKCKQCVGLQNCIRQQLGLPLIQKPKRRVIGRGKVRVEMH